jgi:Carboxypeptidase regulatory-like domain
VRRACSVALVLVLLACVATVGAYAKDSEPQTKILTGRVVDRGDNPLAGSVVYLTNTRTRAVKTYIAGKEGDYRFPGLAPNTDYEVYAQYQGHRSDSKTVSQFDSRMQPTVNLKIDLK